MISFFLNFTSLTPTIQDEDAPNSWKISNFDAHNNEAPLFAHKSLFDVPVAICVKLRLSCFSFTPVRMEFDPAGFPPR